ncbi:MAG TPA: hypothetical protein DD979_01370 [Gammaproteobacteria bacterium]|nr:hypothetical protein [Gammaproteobacteria bacterium]
MGATRCLRGFLLGGCVLALAACGEGGKSSSLDSDGLRIALPKRVFSRVLDPSGLIIMARLTGKADIERQLNVFGDSASGVFEAIPFGDYDLEIRIRYESGDAAFDLARAKKPVRIDADTVSVSVLAGEFAYVDDDKDNYSNLIEYEQGTDRNDRDVYPQAARMFTTSQQGSGNLSSWDDANGYVGTDAADAICEAAAARAALDGDYRAWISDSETDAYCRLLGLQGFVGNRCEGEDTGQPLGPWVRVDGKPFSGKRDALLSENRIFSPPAVDEYGSAVAEKALLWTGATSMGYLAEDESPSAVHCQNWRSGDTQDRGRYGMSTRTVFDWTDTYFADCAHRGHLMCFETSRTAPLPDVRARGKRVFLSESMGTGDVSSWDFAAGLQGVAAGDAVCQADAHSAGLPHAHRYKAWLSDGDLSAIDRIQGNGPWVRLDGMLVARDKAQLRSGLSSSISVDSLGEHVWAMVLTGTAARSMQYTAEASCQGWSSASPGELQGFGLSAAVDHGWTEEFGYSPDNGCAFARFRLYCFEDE